MRMSETISTSPIAVEKSIRAEQVRVLTSCKAGKVVPVTYIPLLREDRVSRGSVTIKLDMAETIHPLMNAVNVTAYAHIVPFLAFERFGGSMETLNRSYQGIGEPHSGVPVPFFTMLSHSLATTPIGSVMGWHFRDGDTPNAAVVEAYNEIVNFRRRARSEKLPLRTPMSNTLADAFWKNTQMSHIVPDFDQAMMDGEVEMSWANARVPISGIGLKGGSAPSKLQAGTFRSSHGPQPNGKHWEVGEGFPAGTDGQATLIVKEGATGFPDIHAELSAVGVKLSLSNIELAKQTAAFAKLREKYQGLEDDHIIDLLMEGIRVPDEAMKQPILLDRKSTIFGYSERHAMDGANLDMSRTTGFTELRLNFRTPPMNTGGIILITLEIVPEQLFERQQDLFMYTGVPSALPNFLRDYLDPEKVEVVQNRYADTHHSNPTGVFGYAPLNHQWKRSITRVGGRYKRPHTDTFIEDRQRFWSIEQLNPTLNDDFYMVRNLPHTVFADSITDPFEILASGRVEIIGNTVFGKALEEDEGHYDAVAAQVDQTRIVQP